MAHTASPEPDGVTRGFRARKGGRFRHEPERILYPRACGMAAARVERALAASKGDPARGLHSHSQSDPVVRRVDEILFRTQVPLGRLNRSVAQEQLNLLQLAVGGAA